MSYGRKLSEIKSLLPNTKNRGYGLYSVSEKQLSELRTKIINLIKTIDKENKSVFIVHGRDEKMLTDVSSALSGLGVPSVILSREDNEGRTIIEKFEKESNRCEYAVILCSGDDEGRLRQKGKKSNETPMRPRARQNVILELGYFLGKLGRKNMFVLHPEESIEQPSDFYGVVYETFDKGDRWKDKLVRELKAAGFKISSKAAERI